MPPTRDRRCGLAALLATAALVSACGTYEPPRPGVHLGAGVKPDIQCSYEAPTGTVFSSLRCKRREDVAMEGEIARETADAIRVPPPDIK